MTIARQRPLLLIFFMVLFGVFLALVAGAPLMGRCMGADKNQSLTQSSYTAADMLIQQSRSLISQETPFEIGVLTDLDNPNERTNFGRVVTDQIASRFVQLGYTVQDVSGATMTPPSDGESPSYIQATPATGRDGIGRSVITGGYAVARDAVLVNLRIIDPESGKVVAAYDYSVPMTRDVRELVKSRADKDSFFNF